MIRRIAKRGFNNKFALKVGEVNVADLEAHFNAGDEVTPDSLREKDLANYKYDVLKVLGKGEISKKSKNLKKKNDSSGSSVISKDHYKLYRPNRNRQHDRNVQSSRFLQTNFNKNQRVTAASKGTVAKKKRSGSKKSSYSQKFQKKTQRSKETVKRKKKRWPSKD